jgi:hypothetical protein
VASDELGKELNIGWSLKYLGSKIKFEDVELERRTFAEALGQGETDWIYDRTYILKGNFSY